MKNNTNSIGTKKENVSEGKEAIPQQNMLIEKLKRFFTRRRSFKILLACGVAFITLVILSVVIYVIYSRFRAKNNEIANLNHTISYLQDMINDLQEEEGLDSQEEIKDEDFNEPEIVETEVKDESVDTYKIEVDFLATPEVADAFSIFLEREDYPGAGYYDPDDDATFYKAGVVTSGEYTNIDGTSISFVGYDYYLGVYAEWQPIDEFVPNYLRFLRSQSDDTVYLVDRAPTLGLPQVEEYVVDLSGPIDESAFYYLTEDYLEFPNVKSPEFYRVIESDGGNYFSYEYFLGTKFSDMNLEKIDSFRGHDIYVAQYDDSGASYMRSSEGFVYVLIYVPKMVQDSDFIFYPIPNITWSDGTINEVEYDYISIGGCFENALEIEIVDPNNLESAGTTVGSEQVYEMKDKNDEYRRRVYEEDYLGSSLNDWNDISEDDEGHLTYEEFLSHHPVFYWRDPFGRYIKFANRNFVMTGGCAKPVIYLYPDEVSDIEVKVIPNGVLTFTAPRYEDGWEVTAYPDGRLVNRGDQKEYSYLWWESRSNGVDIPEKGFVVRSEELESLLDEKLEEFGLNSREISDFQDYWLEKMLSEKKDYYFITFLFDKEVERIARIEFSKKPDVEMRIFMIYEPLDSWKEVESLDIPYHQRVGFTAVEWGGAKINKEY